MKKTDTQKYITIRDLATQLALSPATISRALNNEECVRHKTKKRVFELAEQLGYRSNDFARILRSNRSNTIGCIVPRLDHHLMSTVISGIEQAARREEYSLLIMQSHGSKATEAFCADILFNKRVDGLVVADEQYIIRKGLSREDGIWVAEEVTQWKQMPDALFAADDMCAAGCVMALSARGIPVPGEIAVAGFGNDPVSLAIQPNLTTAGYPGYQVGKAAVCQLVQHLQGTTVGRLAERIVVRCELLIRGTTVIS